MLNRDLIVVRLKQPFVDWVNEADPYPNESRMTLKEVNEDQPVFLIHDYACEDMEGWLEHYYQPIFEELLEQWYVDEALWPQDLTLELFKTWCGVEIHSMIVDLVDQPLIDDTVGLSDRVIREDG
jgi:hypothetical protein